MLRPIFFIVLFSVLSQFALSRQPGNHFFTHYGKRDGLAANDAISIAQDDKGFIWIGTIGGLQRFDGTRFLTFKAGPNSSGNLRSSSIGPLYFDAQKRLWIVFGNGGIGFFDTRKFVYTDVKVVAKDSSVAASPRKIIQDDAGNIYMLTYELGQLYRFNISTNSFTPSPDTIKTPPGWVMQNMYHDPATKKIWITSDSGMAVYNLITKKLNYRDHNEENETIVEATKELRDVRIVFRDSKNRFWIKVFTRVAPYYTLYLYETNNGKPVQTRITLEDQVKGSHDLFGFLETKNGTIWTRGYRVLAEFSERDKKFRVVPSGIINERGIQYEMINVIYEDHEQNIWVPTNNNGLYRFNPPTEYFTSIAHYTEDSTTEASGMIGMFMPMRDGSTLVSAIGEGLYRYDSQLNKIPVNMSGITDPNYGHAMFRTRDKRYILITARSGFFVHDEIKNESRYYNPSLFNNQPINYFSEDKQGNFWIGVAYNGLFKCPADSEKRIITDRIIKIDGIPSLNCTANFFDHQENLWIGTLGGGAFLIDPVTNKILKQFDTTAKGGHKLISNDVESMLQLNDSIVLIATGELSIYNYNTDKVRQYDLPEGLLPEIGAMEKDRSGKVWLGLLNGLCRLDLQAKSYTLFDRNDGLVNDIFSQGVSSVMPDGRLLFGTINSFLVLDPQEIERKQSPVYPFYTGFTSANRSLSVDSLMQKEIIRLSPNENSIVIEFSDMSYRKDYKLWYKLEGLDKDWRRSDGLNQAIYSYLPSGDYMFTVRAEGEDGQIKESKPLKIKVNPPFYLSWWFYGVISLVIASLTYWYDREKQAKRKAVEKTRSQIADDLYHEINVTLNNIYMLSEMARIKADNNAPLSKEYIGQIHTKSKTMITAMDDILWSIKPENDDMEKFFRRMRELAEALSHEKDATISLSIADKAKMLQPDAKHKLLFYQVFKEAIQATLLAGGKQLTIEIDLVKGNLLFRLHDATATIDKSNEEIARLLKSLQERTAQLEGELDIESNHAGVSIAVAFPIS